ncbi:MULTISPECIES: FadR/GntR family transcriptional regulator [Saccharopolyspora]|uniref:FadR/GntR family transcriptional regulator n=1 Tax=Saccharopolyspora TaxID=1835 RepID=UPI001CD6AE02|nr:FCD domain-containing protein [Saccharopolyspora sp. 6M]MCA1224579.1 FCD domain-containing protein [Saccharopolyspora sp. 6M]
MEGGAVPVDETLRSLRRWSRTPEPADAAGVAGRIAEAIVLGLLPDGERVPGGAELAALLGCRAEVARDALGRLAGDGLVITSAVGPLIRRPADPLLVAGTARLRELDAHALREISDQHSAIAGTAALLAAERATADELTALRALAAEFAAATGTTDRRRLDGRLHIEIAAAAQSSRLTHQEIALQTETGALRWLPWAEAIPHGAETAQHAAILDAIEAGAGDRARALAEDHVRAGIRRLVEFRLWSGDRRCGR